MAWACLLASFLPLLVVVALQMARPLHGAVISLFFLVIWLGLLWPFIQHRRGRALPRQVAILYVLALIACALLVMPFVLGIMLIH